MDAAGFIRAEKNDKRTHLNDPIRRQSGGVVQATEENEPDRKGCLNGFEKFLACQDKLIEEMIHDNFSNPNFGTKLINIKKQQLREEPAAA